MLIIHELAYFETLWCGNGDGTLMGECLFLKMKWAKWLDRMTYPSLSLTQAQIKVLIVIDI